MKLNQKHLTAIVIVVLFVIYSRNRNQDTQFDKIVFPLVTLFLIVRSFNARWLPKWARYLTAALFTASLYGELQRYYNL